MFDSQRLGIPDRCFFEKVLGQQPALNFDFCSGNLRFLAVPKNKTTDQDNASRRDMLLLLTVSVLFFSVQ